MRNGVVVDSKSSTKIHRTGHWTVNPESLGSGKYQLSAGINMTMPINWGDGDPETRKTQFVMQINVSGTENDRVELG